MWRPESIGEVIAERTFDLRRGNRKVDRVTVVVGRPVRAPGGGSREPWWCPVRITGGGIDLYRPIAGDDSLQALVQGLEFTADILPEQADSLRAGLDWLVQAAEAPAQSRPNADPDNVFAALVARLRRNPDERRALASPPGTRRPPVLRAVGIDEHPAPEPRRSPRASRGT